MIRRAFISSAALAAAGGVPPRRVDQYAAADASVMLPPAQPQVIPRLIVAGGGTFVGVFIYFPTQAAGNLIVSESPAQGTDPKGNVFLAGITNYFNTGAGYLAVNTYQGKITFYTAATEAGPWTARSSMTNDPSNNLSLSSPNQVSLLSSLGASLGVGSNVFTVGNFVVGNGNFAYATNPSIGGQETWHTMTGFANSFAAGGETPRYMLKPDNTVRLAGSITAGATNPAGTTFFTLPAGWRPANNALLSGPATGASLTVGSGTVQALTSGALATGYATVAGNAIWLDEMTFPLD